MEPNSNLPGNGPRATENFLLALSCFVPACRTHGPVHETLPVGSLGNDDDSKRGTKLKLGKSLEIYGGVYHSSSNLKHLALKRGT